MIRRLSLPLAAALVAGALVAGPVAAHPHVA